MAGLGSPLLLLIFLAAAAATWAAGIALSKSTDALDARLGLGDEIGGLILLSIAGHPAGARDHDLGGGRRDTSSSRPGT